MSNKSALCVSTYSRDQMEPFASEQTSHVFNVFKVSFQIFPRLVMKPNVQNPLQFGRFQRCTLSEYSCSTTKISKLLAKRFGQKLSLISPVIFIACLTVSYSQRLPHFCAKFWRKKKNPWSCIPFNTHIDQLLFSYKKEQRVALLTAPYCLLKRFVTSSVLPTYWALATW